MNNLDSDPGAILPQLLLIIFLTAINAFFASAEMAIVSVNKSKIRKLSKNGNKNAILLEKLTKDPSNFLSTIQIGITLAGFFSSASAATGITKYLSSLIQSFNIPYSEKICMVLVTLILSYFTLVFGELVPKRIALKKDEKISLLTVKPIYIISKIAKPFIKLLSVSTSVILKLTKNTDENIEEKISEEEIKSLISQSEKDGCIEINEKHMIYRVFNFNDKIAREIMTPRNEIFAISIDTFKYDTFDNILNSGYSRIPVYKSSIDNIIGILYTKDLLSEAKKVGFNNINIINILHEPFFIIESQKNNKLFKLLKEKKVHLALLFDEYGGISGLVTMEDLIEEIMGEIEDEYDKKDSSIIKISENSYIVKGYLNVHDFNNRFNVNIEIGDYDTLNGYLITKFGKIPDEKTEIELENIVFKINKVSNKKIEDVNIKLKHLQKNA